MEQLKIRCPAPLCTDILTFEAGIFLDSRLFVAHCSGRNDEQSVHYFSKEYFNHSR